MNSLPELRNPMNERRRFGLMTALLIIEYRLPTRAVSDYTD